MNKAHQHAVNHHQQVKHARHLREHNQHILQHAQQLLHEQQEHSRHLGAHAAHAALASSREFDTLRFTDSRVRPARPNFFVRLVRGIFNLAILAALLYVGARIALALLH